MNQRRDYEILLPHRDGMLLRGRRRQVRGRRGPRLLHMSAGTSGSCRGTFPGNPVVPGVMLCEMHGAGLLRAACGMSCPAGATAYVHAG